MPCYRPLEAWQTVQGEVVFNKGQGNKHYDLARELNLACGQCVGCRLERSRQWAVRCTHEKQFHEESAFLTLTIRDADMAPGGSLDHRDIQLFLKKLRRHTVRALPRSKIPRSARVSAFKNQTPRWDYSKVRGKIRINYLRYYMCGEYGPRTDRAHYHMILYGTDFKDKRHHTVSRSNTRDNIYTSKTLDKIWGKGDCYIGEVTFESAAYVARYIMKKVNGPKQQQHYERIDALTGEIFKRQPEYTRMSLKPGIGKKWIDKYESDVYPEGTVLARGHKSKSPKYYDKLYKKKDPLQYDDLLWQRMKEANPADNTPERLATRERVAKAKIAFLKRNNH